MRKIAIAAAVAAALLCVGGVWRWPNRLRWIMRA